MECRFAAVRGSCCARRRTSCQARIGGSASQSSAQTRWRGGWTPPSVGRWRSWRRCNAVPRSWCGRTSALTTAWWSCSPRCKRRSAPSTPSSTPGDVPQLIAFFKEAASGQRVNAHRRGTQVGHAQSLGAHSGRWVLDAPLLVRRGVRAGGAGRLPAARARVRHVAARVARALRGPRHGASHDSGSHQHAPHAHQDDFSSRVWRVRLRVAPLVGAREALQAVGAKVGVLWLRARRARAL